MFSVGHRSNNFIVGLTNSHSALHTPALWNYTLCGQYHGAVPAGATVTVHCTNVYNSGRRFRYVIVHFPLINEPMNVCEIEVFTVGRFNRLEIFLTYLVTDRCRRTASEKTKLRDEPCSRLVHEQKPLS